jgi:nucleoid-associated protein YgaU
LFTSEALEILARGSGGIPRNINNLCFNALSIGCALRKKRIDRAVAEEALQDRQFESLLRAGNPSRPVVNPAPPRSVAAPRRRTGLRQAALLAAAMLIAGVLGASAGLYAWRAQWPLARLPLALKPVVTLFDTPAPPVPPAPAPAAEPVPDSDPPKPAAPEHELVVVAPHQTLTDIGKLYLGEYNAAVLAKLRELNPGLGDPNHLEVGQQIRLPAAAAGDSGKTRENGEQQAASRGSR